MLALQEDDGDDVKVENGESSGSLCACLLVFLAAKVMRTSNNATVVISADTRNVVKVVTASPPSRRQVVFWLNLQRLLGFSQNFSRFFANYSKQRL